MTQDNSLARHALAVLALPVVVTILVPALLVTQSNTYNPGWGLPFPANLLPIVPGIGLIMGGLALVAMTVGLFKSVGHGTLAPWDPTQRLVITGVYRYVRNPMISGVASILCGEAILFGSSPLLFWAALVIAVNVVYIPLSEESGLRKRFGLDYQEYTRHVPRWLPRRTPWVPPANRAAD